MVELAICRAILAADRIPEVAEATTKGLRHLRKPLRPKHEQHDYEQEQQVRRLEDVPNHSPERLARCDRGVENRRRRAG